VSSTSSGDAAAGRGPTAIAAATASTSGRGPIAGTLPQRAAEVVAGAGQDERGAAAQKPCRSPSDESGGGTGWPPWSFISSSVRHS